MTRGPCREIPLSVGGENRPKCRCLTTLERTAEERVRGGVDGAGAIPFRNGEVGEFADASRREQLGRREPVDRRRRGEQPAAYLLVARKHVAKDGDGEAELAERARVVQGDWLTRCLEDDVQHLGDIAQSQRPNVAITQPLFQLVPIHRTPPRRYSAVEPRDNHPPVAAPPPRANSAFIRDSQITVNR